MGQRVNLQEKYDYLAIGSCKHFVVGTFWGYTQPVALNCRRSRTWRPQMLAVRAATGRLPTAPLSPKVPRRFQRRLPVSLPGNRQGSVVMSR